MKAGVSMCIGDGAGRARAFTGGFTVVEVLLGVALSVSLALGVGRLVVSMQEIGATEADRAIQVVQGRVAAARFEKDLRGATSADSEFSVESIVLEATPYQVVIMGRQASTDGLVIIEWEIAGSRLMRRWGRCPTERPSGYPHALYVDHKTMLEGLAPGASFEYCVGGMDSVSQVSEEALSRITSVRVLARGEDAEGRWGVLMMCEGRVGR